MNRSKALGDNSPSNHKTSNKVYLETFGCQMNISDSERVSADLEKKGYEFVSTSAEADVILLNTCSIRERAEHKLFSRIGEINKERKQSKPILGVLGCVAQLEGENLFNRSENIDFVLGTQALGRVGNLIEQAKNEKKPLIDVGAREADYDWSPAVERRHSPYVAFVPIIEGCNKFCTYCIVPFSRGREKSLTADEIVRQVLALKNRGVREIHLIGQNVNSYRPQSEAGLESFHGATPFSRLLRAVAATGIERVKFTTSFPRDFHADIVSAINECENLCNWVHLPIQSGSDRILRSMRRGHTIDNYLKRVAAIRNSPRRIALTTDVIIGFPGETAEDFAQTVKLFEECRFDGAYIFKYSERPGTPAAVLPDSVSAEEKRSRFVQLDLRQRQIQTEILNQFAGETLEVLAEKPSAKSPLDLTGHSTCHRVVNFTAAHENIGRILKVRITNRKSNSFSLNGRVIV